MIRPPPTPTLFPYTTLFRSIGQDYVRTARAKGLPEDTVVYRHALRNALLPFVTMFGFLLPGLIGGSVIFEQILDRKSTRLNSSHLGISYAVFCLKKKKKEKL